MSEEKKNMNPNKRNILYEESVTMEKKMRKMSESEMDKVSGGVVVDKEDHIAVINPKPPLNDEIFKPVIAESDAVRYAYGCPWCDQRFQTSIELQTHIAKEHELKPGL